MHWFLPQTQNAHIVFFFFFFLLLLMDTFSAYMDSEALAIFAEIALTYEKQEQKQETAIDAVGLCIRVVGENVWRRWTESGMESIKKDAPFRKGW